MSDALLRKQIEEHPQYKKLSARAVRLFEQHKTYVGEIPLSSTKGVREQNSGTIGRTSLGRKGYLLLTESNLYWLGLRGSSDVSGLTHKPVPQQFLGSKTSVLTPGGAFHTRHSRAVHVRRFIELNNLLARLRESTHSSATTVTAPAPGNDVTEQITKLAALRDQGHITADEYDRKKAELLERL